MKLKFFRRLWDSIGFKLYSAILILILPLSFFLFYNNNYAINVVRNQVAKAYNNTTSFYMQQIDSGLLNVDSYLFGISDSNPDFLVLRDPASNINERQLAKIHLFDAFNSDVMRFQLISSVFLYSVNDDAFIMAANDNEGAPTTDVIKTYVIEETRNDETESVQKFGGWQMIKLDDSYYLFHLIKYGTIYLGAWVDTDKLLEPVVLSDTGPNNLTVFVDGEGSASNDADIIEENNINLKGSYENYYISGSQNKFLIVGEDSRQGNFSLVSLIRNDKMLENLPYLMQTSIILAILLIIILPISFLLLRKTVIFPLKKIVNTMQVIQKGNIDARINSYNTSREFHIVNKAFNDMMEQIKELKISVYEEKVNMQKAELKQLQMQINPHFFMNSLNVIHSLALTENYKLIQEMVQCLTSYFQYMAHINRPLVLLKDEIQHVDNYIRIQKMRFPDCLTYEIKASDFIMDILVPPQIIQLFVENTIKHALTTDKPIHLSVNIKMYDREDKPFLKIVINDTGKGFDEVVLEKLNADVLDINENDDHIGIWNIRNTLNLLYSDEAKISFSNLKPSGASVTIEFPAKTRNQQEGSD